MSNWNGKIKCIKGLFTYFTEGKIYEVENGCIIDNDKTLWSNVGKTYENLNDFHTSNGTGLLFEEVKDIPKLCEILGLKPNEKFKINFNNELNFFPVYYINNEGHLIFNTTKENFDEHVPSLINGKFTIIKMPRYHFTEDEIIIMKTLLLNGYHYITRDKCSDLFAHTEIPEECEEGDYLSDGFCCKLNRYFFEQIRGERVLYIDDELKRLS